MKFKTTSWLLFTLLAASQTVRGEEIAAKEDSKKIAQEKTTEPKKTEEQKLDHNKLSIALGHFFVRNLTKSQSPLKIDRIIDGMKAELKKKESPMTQEEFQQAMVMLQLEQYQALSEKNLKEANTFLEKNAKEQNVVSLVDAKLQYKIAKSGEGEDKLTQESKPLVRIEGKLLDGTVFSANKEGQPLALSLKETVPGIAQGMVGMKKGEKRTLYIHPEMAFGANSPLPPNSLIVFDVEVIDMTSPEPKLNETGSADVKQEEKPTAAAEKTEKAIPTTKS